jgi:hypothetical protein
MTATALLERREVVPPAPPPPAPAGATAVAVLEDARTKLGYVPARDAAAEQGDELRLALRQLDIHPFTPSSVDRYKARRRREAVGFTKRIALAATCAVLACVAFTLALMVSDASPFFWPLVVLEMLTLPTSIYLSIDTASTLRRVSWQRSLLVNEHELRLQQAERESRESKDLGELMAWRRQTFFQSFLSIELPYTKPVPLFVLQTAMRIQERVPNARLRIEELRVRSREEIREERAAQRAMLADPFLVVTYGDCTVYVEVWNEPTFDAQREV